MFYLLRRALKSEFADALNQQLPKPVPEVSLFTVVSRNKVAQFKGKRNGQPSGNVWFERSSSCTALLRAALLMCLLPSMALQQLSGPFAGGDYTFVAGVGGICLS